VLRRWWLEAAMVAGIIAVAMFSHINIGIRHVLPIYVPVSILAAAGAVWLLEVAPARPAAGWALAILGAWYAAGSLWSHPDYLPYFNELAGSHPERIVVDSDLDWGQDEKRLARRLRQEGARELTYIPFMIGPFEDTAKAFGLPPIRTEIDAFRPDPGWNAVSLTLLRQRRLGLRDAYPNLQPWPDRVGGGELIGKSILLYYFPPR
jgi:hypothetical protein